MIGDRKHDVQGARDAGVRRSVGVLYGYGSRGELEPFAPLYLAPSAGALRAWLLQRKDQGEAALPEKE